LTEGGVLHVAAAVGSPSGAVVVFRIGPRAPRSSTDRFVLGLSRARADAIITTGRILREEPRTTHDLGETPSATKALLAWRRDVLGKAELPWSVVLTRGGLDLDHPLLARGRAVIVTGRKTADSLSRRARAAGVLLLPRARPSLRDAIEAVRNELRGETVCIEAGPSTARALYRRPIAVDELLLSICDGRLAPGLEAGRLPSEGRLVRLLGPPRDSVVRSEGGTRWRFLRFRRKLDRVPIDR
jgi:riboflavin biosynthesis pyrimidine reductase